MTNSIDHDSELPQNRITSLHLTDRVPGDGAFFPHVLRDMSGYNVQIEIELMASLYEYHRSANRDASDFAIHCKLLLLHVRHSR